MVLLEEDGADVDGTRARDRLNRRDPLLRKQLSSVTKDELR
jgi:hypothetical protein